ncbi:hypothetical protein CS542_06400 [Pedobacter sp. IW39]|nr:hypothetical protein CS542_06400 [Pedobacter sp. IW39]
MRSPRLTRFMNVKTDSLDGNCTGFNSDLIISDVMMPNMDGLEFCRRVKTDERTSHPGNPVNCKIRLYPSDQRAETGADAYIIKPFNIKLLQLTLENLLNARES